MANRAAPPRAAAELAFEELWGHRDDVFRAALRELGNVHDAEDVTQQAFVDAYRAVLRGTQPQSPRAWLLAISENVRRRRFRTAQRRPRELPLDDADFPLAAELPSEQAHALAEALAALPAEHRRVFVLREIAGLSYDEIADALDSTVASVQMLLFRARRSLREQLEPPVVAGRRTGVFVPVPGWLTGLASRFEVSGLAPRMAGAAGAAALAVVGASVAVPQAPADGAPPPAADSRPRVAAVTAGAAAPAALSAGAAKRSVRATPSPRRPPVTSSRRTPGPAPTAATPKAAAAPEPTASPDLTAAPAESGPASASPVAGSTLRLSSAPVSLPVETADVVPEVSVPPLPAAPPLPAPVPELVAGAAGAAGASAPPLPVEVPPLPTLPPAP